MHVQVVTFGLEGVSEEDYVEGCKTEVATFANIPGLIAKVWLRNDASKAYGAVYLWREREDYEAYIKGDIWAAVEGDPSLSQVQSQAFEAIEELTRATQPGVALM